MSTHRRDLLARMAAALALPGIAAAKRRSDDPALGIEGRWACGTDTPLQRSKTMTGGLWISKAQADDYLKNKPKPPPGADPVGQSTSEWIEGHGLAELEGRYMTSWIVDPPDGRLPYTEAGRATLKALETQFDENMDNPEGRDSAERCLGGTVGPPIIDVGYGTHIQIMRTAGHVAIQTEQGFAPRIIPLGGAPSANEPRSWIGVSRARFEGHELIVETSRFHQAYLLRNEGFYLSPDARVTERFTRAGKEALRYAFTIEDPAIYTQPWRAMMVFKATDKPMFDFACHEGNYGLTNILAGAREIEKAKAKTSPTVASQR